MGDQPVSLTGKEVERAFQKELPAPSMEVWALHDFEHGALGLGPGEGLTFLIGLHHLKQIEGGQVK